MTLTASPPTADPAPDRPRGRRRVVAVVLVAGVLVAGGLGAGLALALGGSRPSPPAASSGGPGFDYYRSVMGRYGAGSMMGGYGWMMGSSGYGWMMGGAAAPGWMAGGSLPGYMMGGSADPGQVMGRLFADAPGPRVSASDAARLGNQVPTGAVVDGSAHRIAFSGPEVSLTVVASPPGNPDETFRAAGLVNPTIVVAAGARVSITLVNADPDTAHGLVVTAAGAASAWMPMMTAPPAFPGAAVWFLGNPTSAGLHEATMTFTAGSGGTYQYLCPVPGHAQKGMVGTFLVGS